MDNLLIIEDWRRIDYKVAWKLQAQYQQELVDLKRTARRNNESRTSGHHYLIMCEHKPVYTLGKSGKINHLLLDEEGLRKQGVSYYKINRGGDITYHGPGQLVVYPILDLEFFYTDIHRYIRALEEVVIRIMNGYGIIGRRIENYTGVWTGYNPARKVCAIGVHMSRWVSMHGLAFNVNTDLSYFDHIVPCGIDNTGMTVSSLAKEVNTPVSMDEVKLEFINHFKDIFNITICEKRKNQVIPLQ